MVQIIIIAVTLWLVSALVAYLIIRWGYRSNEWTWDRGEALFTAFACLWCGPFGMVLSIIMFGREAAMLWCPKALTEWLTKWLAKGTEW
jgi:hypothetical protein